jgi:hypothetical protein
LLALVIIQLLRLCLTTSSRVHHVGTHFEVGVRTALLLSRVLTRRLLRAGLWLSIGFIEVVVISLVRVFYDTLANLLLQNRLDLKASL